MADTRRVWGCDAPADDTVFTISCSCGRQKDCPRCKGTGYLEFNRCMTAILRKDMRAFVRVQRFMSAYMQLESGILPCDGPWRRQPQAFLDAVDLVNAERAKWERELHDHQAMKQKMAQNRKYRG